LEQQQNRKRKEDKEREITQERNEETIKGSKKGEMKYCSPENLFCRLR
jgi:hypothetical protein